MPTLEQKALVILLTETKQRLEKRDGKTYTVDTIVEVINRRFDALVAEGRRETDKLVNQEAKDAEKAKASQADAPGGV